MRFVYVTQTDVAHACRAVRFDFFAILLYFSHFNCVLPAPRYSGISKYMYVYKRKYAMCSKVVQVMT